MRSAVQGLKYQPGTVFHVPASYHCPIAAKLPSGDLHVVVTWPSRPSFEHALGKA
jgi:hypothetical protein